MKICPSCLQRFDHALTSCPSDETELLVLGMADDRCGCVVAGQYLVLDAVAQGCQATVYRAYQLSMRREIALKVLDGQVARKARVSQRFLREARALGRVTGAHTVRAFDCGELLTGEPYLAMELLPGRPLDQVLTEEGPLPLPRAIGMLRQVCLALEEVHAEGYVHRDVKPANLMVEVKDGRDRVKLVDFGLVRPLADQVGRITIVGEMIGSPAYISPEQVSGKPVGPTTDIYAVGVLAYELVSGKLPFYSGNVFELLMMHAHRDPPSLLDIIGDAPAYRSYAAIVDRCLSKSPTERYTSMRGLYSAFASVDSWGDERARMLVPTPLPREWAERKNPAVQTVPNRSREIEELALSDTATLHPRLGLWSRLRLRLPAQAVAVVVSVVLLLGIWSLLQLTWTRQSAWSTYRTRDGNVTSRAEHDAPTLPPAVLALPWTDSPGYVETVRTGSPPACVWGPPAGETAGTQGDSTTERVARGDLAGGPAPEPPQGAGRGPAPGGGSGSIRTGARKTARE